MRRLIIFAALAVGMYLVIRKMASGVGPAMRERCSEMCDRMLANMPESFPPNRMMADLESLKDKTARILEMLEERPAVEGHSNSDPMAKADGGRTPTRHQPRAGHPR